MLKRMRKWCFLCASAPGHEDLQSSAVHVLLILTLDKGELSVSRFGYFGSQVCWIEGFLGFTYLLETL